MKTYPIWSKRPNKKNNIQNEKIEKNLTTDILIIGGGITGLTSAYFLKDYPGKVTLIDRKSIGTEVTSKSTAKITYLQQDIYQKLAKSSSIDTAHKYYKSQIEAINIINSIVKTNKFDCDLTKSPSIIFTNNITNLSKIKKEKQLLEKFGAKVTDIKHPSILAGIKIENAYTFNPVKYLLCLKEYLKDKISIYENVNAMKIIKENNRYLIKTDKCIIHAKKVITASHYPFYTIPSLIPLKTYLKREYVCASKIDDSKDYNVINIDNSLISIRYYQDNIIFGSNEHHLTMKTNYQKNYQQSIKDFHTYFHKKPDYLWMNQDIMSNDYLPFIGEVKKNLYLATAYNAWGMTNGTIAAKLITDLIQNKPSPYELLFRVNRLNPKLLVNSFINSFYYLKAYLESLIIKHNPTYIKIKGITYALYIDEENNRHFLKILCPHLKCHLIFNNQEKTWDCPCHGSRFDLDGNLITGPSTTNLKNYENKS